MRTYPTLPVLTLCLLTAIALLVPASPACAAPAEPTLRQMAGQMLLVGFRGTEIDDGHWISKAIAEDNLGGVILFDYDVVLGKPQRNIVSPEQVKKLTTQLRSRAKTPLFVAVDMEGGRVQRLKPAYGYPEFPSAEKLGSYPQKRITQNARDMGDLLARNGFNLDFAPVVDVNVDPQSPAIGKIGRSFSADPEKVAADAEAFINGLHAAGVLSSLKHFPGHGSANADSHLGVTDVTRTWSEAELIPYRRLIAHDKVDMIMTAHIFNANLDHRHPATLSENIVSGLLRKKLEYDGVVVTDDLQMKAIAAQYALKDTVRLALQAGCDILLFGNNLSHDPLIVKKTLSIIESLVAEKRISEERIRTSYERIQALKNRLSPAEK